MTDATELALAAIGGILPAARDVLCVDGETLYCALTDVDEYDFCTDNKPAMRTNVIQADVWQRGGAPVAEAAQVQAALEAAGFYRTRRDSGCEQVNGVMWHRISMDFEITQEVD
jgi:hypothetical protein